MSPRRLTTLASVLALAASNAQANHNLNTSLRRGSIALPSIDGTSASDDAAGAEQGQATYRVPIVAPPGKPGVEPELEIVYGGRGDGPLGTGWSLSVPSIRVKTSGRGGQVSWGTDETYVGFGGEDLVAAGTVADRDGDGQLEDAYREERDFSFIRYVRLSDGGSWIAEYPDGRKLTLGATAAGRVERVATGWVARWLPETLEDTVGNQLTYTWEAASVVEPSAVSPTERYLTAVRWGCQACASATAYQEMRFAYARRDTLAAGSVIDLGAGFLVETELYLTSIVTSSQGEDAGDVRTYSLGYDTSKPRLLLTSIAISTADAVLPPLTFGYTTASPQVAQPELVTGAGVLFKSGVQPMDLDEDGRVDVVDLSTTLAPKLYANNGAAGASFPAAGAAITAPGALPTSVAVSVTDKNRDLGVDVYNLGTSQVYLHQGASGWGASTAVTALPAIAFGTDTVHADIDLDGRPDLVDTSGATTWKIYFNDGNDDYTGDVVECTAPTTPVVGSVLHARDAGVLLDDVTADGFIDVIYVTAAGSAYVFPGRGRGCWGYLPEDGHGATSYDLLSVASVGGFPVPANLRTGDLDGDGYADLVEVGSPSRFNVWMFKPGIGWQASSPSGPWVQSNASTSGCHIADFDHDAVVEVLCSTGWKLYDFADQAPFLLQSVNNGRGLVTTFQYTTSARVAAAHAAAGQAWTTNVAAAVPVVAAITESDGRGHVLERTFDYRDAYYITDELDERFVMSGFGYVAEKRIPKLESGGVRGTDPADGGVLVRRFYDVGAGDYFRRGLELCEETWPGAAVPSSFACLASTGTYPLEAAQRTYQVTIDPTYGFVTVQRTVEERLVAEGTSAPARLRTEWTYDSVNNVLAAIEYGRYRTNNRLWGNDERAVVTDYAVDTTSWNLRLPTRVRKGKITAAGAFSQLTLDQYFYDGANQWQVSTIGDGLLTKQKSWFKHPVTGAQATVTTLQRTYTSRGLVATETDAAGTVTAYAYDGSLQLLRTREELDPGGLALVQQSDLDSRTGVEVRRVAADGTVTEAGYDLLGRMTWLARPGDSPVAPTITRTYVDAAPLSTRTDASRDGTADGLRVVRTLDGHGRLVCQAREARSGKLDLEQWDHSARGEVALSLSPFRATQCDPIAISVVGGVGARSTTRDHDARVVDALARPLTLTHSDGSARTWAYPVLAVIESDEEDATGSVHQGTPTTRRTDGLGRVIGVDEVHVLDDADPGTHTMTYVWDALGNLTQVTDGAARIVYSATYDSRARRVRSVDADLGQTDTAYDLVDRPLTITDARGITESLTWDDAGRVTQRATPDGVTSYTYDVHPTPGASAGCHTAGRLARVVDPSGSEVFCYDERGNLTQSDKVVDAHGATPLVTQQDHDALDRLTAMTYPDGTVVSFTHGDDGRVLDVTATSGAFAFPLATMTYRASGQIQRVDLGNGVDVIRTYDARQRPDRLLALAAPPVTWVDLTLAYDDVGNLLEVIDGVGQESAQYTYDDLYRLTSATGARFGGATATYRYDRHGNLTRKESTDLASAAHVGVLEYLDPSHLHAVSSAGGESFTYDAAGHLIADGTHELVWNDRGYLAAVEELATGASVYSVIYDHLDRRVFKLSASGDSVVYVPASGAELRTEAGVATWVKRVAVAGLELARIDGTFSAADVAAHVTFPIADHLGSPLVVLDAAGSLVERASTHPWGEENTASLAAAGTLGDYVDPSDPTTTLERRFQGRERDETGDYDYGARMYRPELGRFMSADTVVPDPGASQSWNRYAFVRNNPLRYVDPTGHEEIEAPLAGVTPYTATHPGAIGGDRAYAISDVPASRWVDAGPDGVDGWREYKRLTGDDTFGEALADPLLKFKSQKFKGSIEAGPASFEATYELGTGKTEAGVKASGATPVGGKLEGKCTNAGTCDLSIKTDVATIGPHPVSVGWKPLKEEVTVSVGPQMSLGPGMKAKLVLETAFTYSTDMAYRYAGRLWSALTAPPTQGLQPTPGATLNGP